MTATKERFKRALADGFAAADEARRSAEEEFLLAKIQARRPIAEECPRCAIKRLTVGTMELRFNTKGGVAFTPFFGCSRWPVCTHTRAFDLQDDMPLLRAKMPGGTYQGFVRAFDGPRAGEVFWVEGSTAGTGKMTVFVSETEHSVYRLNQLVVWEPQPHEAAVQPDGQAFALRAGASIPGVAATLGFRPLTHQGKAFVVPEGVGIGKHAAELDTYTVATPTGGALHLRVPPHPVSTPKEEPVPAYNFQPDQFVMDGDWVRVYVCSLNGGAQYRVRSASGSEYDYAHNIVPWTPEVGDLVHVGDQLPTFVVMRVAGVNAAVVKHGDTEIHASFDQLQPLVTSNGQRATTLTSNPRSFYHDRQMQALVEMHTSINDDTTPSTTNQEIPMTEEKKTPRVKKTMKEQGSVIVGAMATGAAMGATSQAGELILGIGKKLSKNSPLLLALLEDPAGAELAKFLIAIGIHTGAESTMLPGAEFAAEAAKLQITYSVAKGTEMGMGMFAAEFAALAEIGKSVLARKEKMEALEEDAESVERVSSGVRGVPQHAAG